VQREQVLALATEASRNCGTIQDCRRERKRMVRLLIEDVTIGKGRAGPLDVRFRGACRNVDVASTAGSLRWLWHPQVAAVEAINVFDMPPRKRTSSRTCSPFPIVTSSMRRRTIRLRSRSAVLGSSHSCGKLGLEPGPALAARC